MREKGKKIASIAIILIMYSTIFAMTINVKPEGSGSYPPPTNGDWLVGNITIVSNETITLNGNLTVNATGELYLTNVTLKFNSTTNGQYQLKIEGGGKLFAVDTTFTTVNNSNSYYFRINDKAGASSSNNTMVGVYDSWILYTQNGIEINTDNVTIENSFINNSFANGINIFSSDPGIINNLISSNTGDGIFINSSNPDILNNEITSNNIGINVTNSTVEIYQNKIENSTIDDLYLASSTTLTVNDTTFNKTDISILDTSKLIVNWSFDLEMMDYGDSLIPSASAIVKDKNGVEIYNSTTDFMGSVRGIFVKEYEQLSSQNYSNATFYTPHNVSSTSNTYTGYLNITVDSQKNGTVRLPGPNLCIQDWVIDSDPATDNATDINFTIKNTGDRTVNNITIKTYVGQSYFGEKDIGFTFVENYTLLNSTIISSLASNANTTLTINWSNPTEGMQNIKVTIDENENITEVDEDNNLISQGFYVSPNNKDPYVVYGEVRDNFGLPVNGATVYLNNTLSQITATTDEWGRYDENLLNINLYSTVQTISVWAELGIDVTLSEQFVPDLNGGKKVDLAFGTNNGEDPSEAPPDVSNGTNLMAFGLNTIVKDSDGNYHTDGNLLINIITTLEVFVYNNGSENVTNVTVQFLDDGSQIGSIQTISSIVSGDFGSAIIDWIPSTNGTHYITAVIDHNNSINETIETDNDYTLSKNIRDPLQYDLTTYWNNVTTYSLNNNFTAGSIVAGTHYEIQYVVYHNVTGEGAKYINYIKDFSDSEADFQIDMRETVYIFHPPGSRSDTFTIGSGIKKWTGNYVWDTSSGAQGYYDGLRLENVKKGGHMIFKKSYMAYVRVGSSTWDLHYGNMIRGPYKQTLSNGWLRIYATHYVSSYYFSVIYLFNSNSDYINYLSWARYTSTTKVVYSYWRNDVDVIDADGDELGVYRRVKNWWWYENIWDYPSKERGGYTYGGSPREGGRWKIEMFDDKDYDGETEGFVKLEPWWGSYDRMAFVRYNDDEEWESNNKRYTPLGLAGYDSKGNQVIKNKNDVLWYQAYSRGTYSGHGGYRTNVVVHELPGW